MEYDFLLKCLLDHTRWESCPGIFPTVGSHSVCSLHSGSDSGNSGTQGAAQMPRGPNTLQATTVWGTPPLCSLPCLAARKLCLGSLFVPLSDGKLPVIEDEIQMELK